MKIKREKKNSGGGGSPGGGSGLVGGGGGQGGCERRIEVFVNIQKKLGAGVEGGESGWGVRVDVIEELKFLGKFTKKKQIRGKVCSGGGGSDWGVRVDVNEELKFL